MVYREGDWVFDISNHPMSLASSDRVGCVIKPVSNKIHYVVEFDNEIGVYRRILHKSDIVPYPLNTFFKKLHG